MKKMSNVNRLIVVDGKNLLWRNSDAFSDLSTIINGKECFVGGMYGFISGLIRIKSKYRGKICIAWEGKNNFRYKLYPQYKKKDNRSDFQIELLQEVKQNEIRLRKMLSYANVSQFYGIGCEADDVMATIAYKFADKTNVFIYTGDSDLRQVVNDKINVVSHSRSGDIIFNIDRVKEKHGVYPCQIPLLKALAGDHSDNIPGIKSIGDKTAVKLINQYNSFKNIVKAAKTNDKNWPVPDRFKDMLLNSNNIQNVLLFLKLTKVRRNIKFGSIKRQPNKSKVIKLLKLYKFRSLSSAAELISIMDLGEYI